nr:hypothetical protein [Tanacetum cinerariifolium]
MEPNLKVDNDEGGEEIDSTEYRRLVGCLRYLTHTRPDLSYFVRIVSRFMEKLTTLHFQVVKRILRYIRGTADFGINYEKGLEFKDLVGFIDSNHGGDPVGGKSTRGMIFYLGRNAITWQSQKQKTVALSSCEADFHGRSKHINIRFHFIKECVEQGKIIVEHVNTKDHRGDLFTKVSQRRKKKLQSLRSFLAQKSEGASASWRQFVKFSEMDEDERALFLEKFQVLYTSFSKQR